ncbi:MAG: rhomboid family intramembrane serine protease [Lachnospiraceae bacterium]|nr:rhomboid family intramembrane serine protease [Lachnospiraceae bacterium]
MKFIYKLERKFGRYSIRNLSFVLICCYAIGYVLQLVGSQILSLFTLNPYLILHGQVWRLVTWILVPPDAFGFFTLLMLYFYYAIGTMLERTWGTFRYNFYIFGGMLFTILGSFAVMGYAYLDKDYSLMIKLYGAENFFTNGMMAGMWFRLFSTYYVNMSIYLAFAATFPEQVIYLMYVLPIKVKYLGIMYAVMVVYEFIKYDTVGRIIIGASLLNFVVFFLLTRNYKRISPQEINRKQKFKRAVRQGERGDNVSSFRGKNVVTRHRCAVCGKTELDDDSLEFRFCSKCDGNYEYCSEHLYSHLHVRAKDADGTGRDV